MWFKQISAIRFVLLSVAFCTVGLTSCAQSTGSERSLRLLSLPNGDINPQEIGLTKGANFIIRTDIDLQGKRCIIPSDVTLVFKGGRIRNGELVGQNTKIEYDGIIFDKVLIEGSWVCPVIKSSMFADLSYDNALKDVLALVSPDIHNKVIISEGNYTIAALKPADICIPVRGDTELIINGTIKLLPNSYGKYYMIHIMGDNIIIRGKGTIIGDRAKHLGKDGQWGFGIYVNKAHHVTISGLSIRECWGDCIYVYGMSADVIIKDCDLSYGRRQGISITSADNVTIENCKISHIKGTAPEYAIDIEPNLNDTVRTVKIKNVVIEDCVGGIKVDGTAPGYIESVDVRHCNVSATKRIPIWFFNCKNAKAIKCTITGSANVESVSCEDVERADIYRNTFQYIDLLKEGGKGIVKRLVRRDDIKRVSLKSCKETNIYSNWEKE